MKRLFMLWALLGMGTSLPAPAAPSFPEIPVSSAQREALGVRVEALRAVSQAPVASLPAVVTLAGAASRPVVVPLAGTVTALLAQDGQTVKRGQPLLQLRSADFLTQRAAAEAAAGEVRVLAAQRQRDQALFAEGIIAERRLQETQAALRAARAASASHAAQLATVRAVPGRSGTYQLLAPASGTLAEAGVAVGAPMTAGQLAFHVQRGSQVWLEAQLPERLMEQVAVGQVVTAGTPVVQGRVLAVGRTVSPTTRGVLLRAELPAGPGLRPGQSTELVVQAPVAAGTVLVPASALVRLQGQFAVFAATAKGFRPVGVTAGLRTSAGTAVTGPGLVGSQIAVSGVAALKAMALAAAEAAALPQGKSAVEH